MIKTTYQKPEIRDANDNIIQQGAFGKNTALANATNDGWIDYVANDLEFLYDLAKDEIVPVPSLPASGQMNKTYLLTTTGVSYRWSGTQWVAVSSSEAVGRAESAALLAEQWATKTDGTVDGTEYSAKYYAGLAEASADDAQDVADDMADHLVQIDKNTGGVSANSKRISNIEKLLQGNLYDYDTDDDSAYTKTVPSGALPYAGIETLGGKTLVWNQQLAEISSTGWTIYSSTYTSVEFDGNVATVTVINDSSTSAYNYGFCRKYSNLPLTKGHSYVLLYDVKSNDAGRVFANETMTADTYTDGTTVNADTWYRVGSITTANKATTRLIIKPIGGDYGGLVYSVKNVMLIDLTLMFGAGNEPSTVAEFEAMFPADYYPYNAGTLLSAGVTEVESVGRNIVDQDSLFSAVSGAKKTGDYWKYGSNTFATKYARNNNNPSPWFYGDNITLSFDMKLDSSESTSSDVVLGFFIPGEGQGEFVGSIHTTPTTEWVHRTLTVTPTAPCKIYGSYASGRNVDVKNFQIEYNSTATAYAPYFDITTPIPAEVRALDGYGWSAGSVSNYIDFERKVFVKNVGRVDMGTLTWQSASYTPYYFQTTLTDKKDGLARLICPKYVVYGSGVASIQGSIGIAQSTTNVKAVCVVDSAHDGETGATFKSAMNGVYLYYELATPIETDISQYLTDNLIEVGAGGTLTFENSNGDDYHIPVPSEVTYMIDLQEAISNG